MRNSKRDCTGEHSEEASTPTDADAAASTSNQSPAPKTPTKDLFSSGNTTGGTATRSVTQLQSSIERRKGEQWATIEEATINASPDKAKLDENLALTVNFKLNGGIRRNFVRKLWEVSYDEHDLGLRMAYKVDLSKQRTKLLTTQLKQDKFVRRGVFFWTRNPELPYRVWATVATEFETILYPKTEEEAQTMLFDVTRSFELPASKLGKGHHTLEAKVHAKWGKHVFTERGEASAKTSPIKISVE